jgi:hypothetical protein
MRSRSWYSLSERGFPEVVQSIEMHAWRVSDVIEFIIISDTPSKTFLHPTRLS